MNETGRRVPGGRSRIWGTALAAVLVLCLASAAGAKDHPGKATAAGPPQAVLEKKALKQPAKAQKAAEKQAAKAQKRAQKQAAKAQRQAAKAQRHGAAAAE
jgi:hypothetical protein